MVSVPTSCFFSHFHLYRLKTDGSSTSSPACSYIYCTCPLVLGSASSPLLDAGLTHIPTLHFPRAMRPYRSPLCLPNTSLYFLVGYINSQLELSSSWKWSSLYFASFCGTLGSGPLWFFSYTMIQVLIGLTGNLALNLLRWWNLWVDGNT